LEEVHAWPGQKSWNGSEAGLSPLSLSLINSTRDVVLYPHPSHTASMHIEPVKLALIPPSLSHLPWSPMACSKP
jgi:hypothetical protein